MNTAHQDLISVWDKIITVTRQIVTWKHRLNVLKSLQPVLDLAMKQDEDRCQILKEKCTDVEARVACCARSEYNKIAEIRRDFASLMSEFETLKETFQNLIKVSKRCEEELQQIDDFIQTKKEEGVRLICEFQTWSLVREEGNFNLF